jgi:hypothetical protein
MITTLGHGKGGHFHDLKIISESLSKNVDIVVINIGLKKSPVINEIDLKVYNIYFNGINIFSIIRKLLNIFNIENPSFIQSFDIQSLCFARLLGFFKRIPVILTKCGGPNPKGYYPYSDNIIVMSLENLKYFKESDQFNLSRIECFPNRCVPFNDDEIVSSEILKIAANKTSFLRISRITDHYKSSLIQSINLVRDLNNDSLKVCLFIVGVIQSEELFTLLKEHSKNVNEVYFMTEDKFTSNASKLINACDIIIGTGRGVMEGASKSKMILTPHKDSRYPVLIEKKNFYNLFSTNFSPRNNLIDFNERNSYETIKTHVQYDKLKTENIKFINEIYNKEFDISGVKDRYMNFYKNLLFSTKFKPFNFFRNFLSTIKTVYFAYKKSKV